MNGTIATFLIIMAFIALFAGTAYWIGTNQLPRDVKQYEQLITQMDTQESKQAWIKEFPETYGLDWQGCLDWLSYHMIYGLSNRTKVLWEVKVDNEGRPQDPIEIMKSTWITNLTIRTDMGYGEYYLISKFPCVLGLCGEHTIVYTQLLLVNGYSPRMMIGHHDEGDHAWVEIDGLTTITIDPTDAVAWRQNNPTSFWDYCPNISRTTNKLWGDRVWTRVHRISKRGTTEVTEEYNNEV